MSTMGRAGQAPMVVVDGVRKAFHGVTVLDGISFEVAAGDVVAFIGSSGSGKTTLLRCIDLLEPIDAGRIVVAGEAMGWHQQPDGRWVRDSERELARKRQHLSMVAQGFHLFSHMTALENVMEGPLTVKRLPLPRARQLAQELLAKVGLADKAHARPSKLSGGQQQRVAIARALAMGPEVMLFDEPTSALDPELAGEVLATMRQLAAEGHTMLVVTHELAFAREVADVVLMFHEGRIVEQGPPQEIFTRPAHEATRRFLARVTGGVPQPTGSS